MPGWNDCRVSFARSIPRWPDFGILPKFKKKGSMPRPSMKVFACPRARSGHPKHDQVYYL